MKSRKQAVDFAGLCMATMERLSEFIFDTRQELEVSASVVNVIIRAITIIERLETPVCMEEIIK